MSVDSLDFAPRLAGRAERPLEAVLVRELGPADISLLGTERGIKPSPLKRLGDRHHQLARVLAEGAKPAEASAITGYDPSRISILLGDPSFKELIEFYRKHVDAAFGDFQRRAAVVTLTALNNIAELVEDDENPLTLDQNMQIVKTLADRTGHAPVSRSVSTNVQVDLTGKLAEARRRLATVAPPAIEGRYTVSGDIDATGTDQS